MPGFTKFPLVWKLSLKTPRKIAILAKFDEFWQFKSKFEENEWSYGRETFRVCSRPYRPGDKSVSRHLLMEKFPYRFLITLLCSIYESMGFTGQISPFKEDLDSRAL